MSLKSLPASWIAIACLVCALGAVLIVASRVEAGTPQCPSTWPQAQGSASASGQGLGHIEFEDFFDDSNDEKWFVVRSADSNSYTTIRAYPAAQGDGGYITGSPDEVCFLVVRRPGDTEDAAEPTQVVFPKEQEDSCPGILATRPASAFPAQRYPHLETAHQDVPTDLQRNALDFAFEVGQRGGTLTLPMGEEPHTYNPRHVDDAYSGIVISYIHEGLTGISWPDNEIEPALAESWSHSEDGRTWTMNLRRGVKWHDGQDFDADDVVFTYRHFHDEPIKKIDDYTVEIVFLTPQVDPDFRRDYEEHLTVPILPQHIVEPVVIFNDEGNFYDLPDGFWNVHPDPGDPTPADVVGTGPFKYHSHVHGESITLVRNDDYWLRDADGNPLPYLDAVVFRFYFPPDPAQGPDQEELEIAAFRAGEIDAIDLNGRRFEELRPYQEAENFYLQPLGPDFDRGFLVFNQNPGQDAENGEPFVDPEKLVWFRTKVFRQAVSHSIDRDRIIREVHSGHGFKQWAFISPAAGDFHNRRVRRYEYDLAQANAMLDCLGWQDTDRDGIREDRSGNDIVFTIEMPQGSAASDTTANIIQEGLQAIGVQAEVRRITFREIVLKLLDNYQWDAIIIGLTGGPDPDGGFRVWHSSGHLHMWNPEQESPATTWEAQIDSLLVKAVTELDHDKRVEYYHEIQEIVAEQSPVLFTTLSERLVAVRDVFGNTTPTLRGLWDARYLYRTDQ